MDLFSYFKSDIFSSRSMFLFSSLVMRLFVCIHAGMNKPRKMKISMTNVIISQKMSDFVFVLLVHGIVKS